MIDIEALTRRWQARYPGVPPRGAGLRQSLPDLWVRFHTLPGGERIARTEAQRAEVLHRYRAVLDALGQPELMTTCGWPERPPELAALAPAAPWLEADECVVHVGAVGPELDRVLLDWVAADRTWDVILAPAGLDWLVHPYDGGVDVISPQREQLRARFAAWLSPRDDGL